MPTLADSTIRDFLAQTAAKTPTPGGGAVASLTGALAAALADMVVSYSLGKKSLAPREARLREGAGVLSRARDLFVRLGDEDADAYGLVNELSRLAPDDPRRIAEEPAAVLTSTRVPLAVIAACADVLREMLVLAGITNRQLRSDLGIAAILAAAAARSSLWNVRVNASSITDPAERERCTKQANELVRHCDNLSHEVERACAEP